VKRDIVQEKRCVLCKVSGFCHGVIETFALLGCYAILVVSFRRFGAAYQSHL